MKLAACVVVSLLFSAVFFGIAVLSFVLNPRETLAELRIVRQVAQRVRDER